MDTRKWKPFIRSDKTDKTANNDTHNGTRFDLPSQLGIAQSTLNTNVKKNMKQVEEVMAGADRL